jgi:hypothetical protein
LTPPSCYAALQNGIKSLKFLGVTEELDVLRIIGERLRVAAN